MARAPSDIGDKLKVSALDDSGPISYPLARVPNNVSYETVSEQPEAEPNQPLSVRLSFHGGFAYTRYDERVGGVLVATALVAPERDTIRAPIATTAITLTGAANPPNYFFETTVNDAGADDGQPVLYVIANEAAEINVYKVSLDSGDFGTLLNTKTFAVTPTQPCGKPVEWNDGSNTKWYLGLGDNNFIQRLTTIVSSTAADTWTASGDADARHLKVVGNQLMRSTDENQVSVLAQGADPLTEANWGGDFFVGGVSTNVTELGEASGLGYVAKEDGFYEWDLIGEAQNVFPEIGNAARNGQGMVYWHGGFMIPAESGFWWTRLGEPVGPDSNPENTADHPAGFVNLIKHGRWMGLSPFGAHIFGFYVASSKTKAYVMWGQERKQGDTLGFGPVIWHALDLTTADLDDFHGVHVAEKAEFSSTESRPCIFYANGNNLRYIFLDKDGSVRNKRGEIDLATSGSVVSGDIDYDLPTVNKQFRVIEGWAEDFAGSGHSFQFIGAIDGSPTYFNVGAAVTSDGFFQRFWTQDSNDVGRSVSIDSSWTGTDNLTSQDGPRLRNVNIRAVAVPNTTREWTFLFAVEDEQSKTAKKVRSELEAYVGDLKKYTLPDRDTFNGVMGKPRLLRADEISALTPRNQEPPHYVIAATVREMSGS
jgi:hypothetical protein